MPEIKITFMYANKGISVFCLGKEKIEAMIDKFINKFNPDSKIIDYKFYYEGNLIDPSTYNQSIEDNELLRKKEFFIISVEKNIKVIKCPDCNYGDCVVSLMHYSTVFYNCEHKHLNISSYDNYFLKDQIYNPESIRCAGIDGNNCTKNAKLDPNFQLCLTCSKLNNQTQSICTECANKHNVIKKGQHKIIKYEDKNYYCKNHIKEMKYYCFQCQKNLCEDCKDNHSKDEKYKGHQIKSIDSLIPKEQEITDLKNSLEEIENNIGELKDVVNNLIYTMNGAMRLYENYCKIAHSIIKKYETFNKGAKDFKNFTIFKCLRNLRLSNKEILDDLISIINAKDKKSKASTLIQYYTDKKDKYYKKNPGTNLNQENDDDWFQEVLIRERGTKRENENVEDKKETKVEDKKVEKKENKKSEKEEHKEKEKEDINKNKNEEDKKKEKIEEKKEEKKMDKNEEKAEDKKEEIENNKKRDVRRKKSKTNTIDPRRNNLDEDE